MFEYCSGKITARLEKSEKVLIENIFFSVGDGETAAIVGKTGAGKTTIASSVMGLLAENIYTEGGFAVLNGVNLAYDERRKALGKQIVYIPQSGHECLNKSRTVKKHFLDAGVSTDPERLLKLVGFEDPALILNMYPFELSGGMAQRVVIALAAVSEPELIIADEPTNGIDESFREEFLALVNNVFPDASKLIITHDTVLALACDSVFNLDDVSGRQSAAQDAAVPASAEDLSLRNSASVPYYTVLKNASAEPVSSGKILLHLENVSKTFGHKAVLNSVCADIPAGSFVGLIGKSGGGKSTLAKIITGLENPDDGEVIFRRNTLFGTAGQYDRVNGLKIQMVYQQPYAVLDPSQKIRKGLRELIKYHGIDCGGNADDFIDKRAADFGLGPDILNHLPTQISGGEAQRAAILKCLMLKPELLILDEATSMLDEKTQLSILDLISKEMKAAGGSVLMISHESALVKKCCNHIYIIDEGQLFAASYG